MELKTGRRNRELCEKTYAMLQDYRGEVCIESFNPFIVAWFRFHGRDLLRGQLAMPTMRLSGPQGLTVPGLPAKPLSAQLLQPPAVHRLQDRLPPAHGAPGRALGAMKVGWTSHEPRNEKGRDAVIFEFYRPKLQYK